MSCIIQAVKERLISTLSLNELKILQEAAMWIADKELEATRPKVGRFSAMQSQTMK